MTNDLNPRFQVSDPGGSIRSGAKRVGQHNGISSVSGAIRFALAYVMMAQRGDKAPRELKDALAELLARLEENGK